MLWGHINHQVCHLRLYETLFHTSHHWWIMSFPIYNRPILLNLLKILAPGSIHGIHNRTQSSGPVIPVTQRCYDVDNRTIHDYFGDSWASFRYQNQQFLTPIVVSLIFSLLFHCDVWYCWCGRSGMLWGRINNQVSLSRINDTPFHTSQYQPLICLPNFLLVSISQVMNHTSEHPYCSSATSYGTIRTHEGEMKVSLEFSGALSILTLCTMFTVLSLWNGLSSPT